MVEHYNSSHSQPRYVQYCQCLSCVGGAHSLCCLIVLQDVDALHHGGNHSLRLRGTAVAGSAAALKEEGPVAVVPMPPWPLQGSRVQQKEGGDKGMHTW